MKVLAKRMTAIVMTLVIVASTSFMPQKVEAADFYTITLNANGGHFSRVGSNIQTIKMPATSGLKVASYYTPDARTNYSFLGWSTSKTATAATYTVNALLPKKTATYYAVWRSLDVTGVKINQSNVTIKMGTTQKLTATVLPDYATDKSIKWSSSNTNFLKVASDGTITPVRPGTATVTVTTVSGGFKASINVTIINGVGIKTSVTANNSMEQIITYEVESIGTTNNDKIVGYYFDGIYKPITPTFATTIKEKADTAKIYTFVAVTENGAKNYTSTIPFYEVTFNSNNNDTKKCLFSIGTKLSVSDTKDMFVREGYSFVGWSTNPKANQPEDISVRGASEYYAVWYKVNISDDPGVISKETIDVKKSYNPTQLYITVTAPDGSIVDYNTNWSVIKKQNSSLPSYRIEKGNLLYTELTTVSKEFSIMSSDGLLTGNVKVNLYENIIVTNEKIINEDGTCTVIYYVHFKKSSLKSYVLNGKEYLVTDVTSYDEDTNTYIIETVITSDTVNMLKIIGEDNSYIFITNEIKIFEENYGITPQDSLKDKNGVAAATVLLQCGKVAENPRGYYLGVSDNYKDNNFYSLSQSNQDNDISISGEEYIVNHYIRKAGKYFYTPIDADGKSHKTYEMIVHEVTLDTSGGNSLNENKYYVFNNKEIKFKELPMPINSKKNKIFRGWYASDGTYTSMVVKNNLILTAKWRTNPFKDEDGNDTGYSFKFEQLRFGFINFSCPQSEGHCAAISMLACKFVTAENDFNVTDFKKVEMNDNFITVNKLADFTNITGADTDNVYINSKTGITLNEYICGYQHRLSDNEKPNSIAYKSEKEILQAVKNIKHTGVPIFIGMTGIVLQHSGAKSIAHAVVAFDVKKVKATSDYTEYNLSIYDPNHITQERTLSIWCNGDENHSDSKWGWKYVWNENSIIGSDYNGSTIVAKVYDCNN